jgi:SM-20-related protein
MIDLEAFANTPLHQEPYKYVIVPNFVSAETLAKVQPDFPYIARAGSYPLSTVKGGKVFNDLIAEIEQPAFRQAMEQKFAIDLANRPTMITIRGRSRPTDGKIHTDSETKLITVLIYLNQEWTQPGGRLRLLRGKDDIEDYAAQIDPTGGTLLAFERSDRSYHAHLPCEGERRSIQLNWVRDQGVVEAQYRRHGLAAFFKHFLPAQAVKD